MPLQDWDLPATWDNAYILREPGTDNIVNYTRSIRDRLNITGRAQGFIDGLGLTAASVCLLEGGAFGWTAEALKAALPGIVANVNDPGAYVQDPTRRATEAVEITLSVDITKNGERRSLALLTSRTMDWIITEEVISIFSDAEVITYLDDLAALVSQYTTRTPRICHYVTPTRGGDPDYNWKTMTEWRSFMDANGHSDDVLIESGNYTVF